MAKKQEEPIAPVKVDTRVIAPKKKAPVIEFKGTKLFTNQSPEKSSKN